MRSWLQAGALALAMITAGCASDPAPRTAQPAGISDDEIMRQMLATGTGASPGRAGAASAPRTDEQNRPPAAVPAPVLPPPVAQATPAAWPDLSRAPSVAAEGSNDAALIVGIDEYAFVPHVRGAARNATDWFTYFTDGRRVPMSSIHLLRDVQATREAIIKQAAQVAREVKPGGTLWFIFIGHGAPARDGSDGLLVGADTQQDADSIYARSVAQQEVLALLAKDNAAHHVLILDACFSGRTGSGQALAAGLQPLIPTSLTSTASLPDTAILSAGGPDQFAGPLPNSDRPAFSYLTLGALRGWGANAQGDVTAEDASNYARKVLTVLPIGRTQEPRVTGALATMVLSHRATEPGPDLHDIIAGRQATLAPANPPPLAPSPPPSPPPPPAPAVAAPVAVRAPEPVADVAPTITPSRGLVTVGSREIAIRQQVHFAVDSAIVLPDSLPLLGELADTLRTNATLRVEIQGHMDNSGTPEHNKELSEARADAVRNWLVAHGVPAERLVAHGYGQEKPLMPNVTAAMRARNRRIQLVILP